MQCGINKLFIPSGLEGFIVRQMCPWTFSGHINFHVGSVLHVGYVQRLILLRNPVPVGSPLQSAQFLGNTQCNSRNRNREFPWLFIDHQHTHTNRIMLGEVGYYATCIWIKSCRPIIIFPYHSNSFTSSGYSFINQLIIIACIV